MSTGNMSLDILLGEIAEDAISGRRKSISSLKNRFPSLSDKEAYELFSMFQDAFSSGKEQATLVATMPPSFSIKAKSTLNTVRDMLEQADNSILITGYSLSDYVSELIDMIIRKSQSGVFVKFFINQIDTQNSIDKLVMYKGRFLKIYNYSPSEDRMAALHAKVISVDRQKTLITSANLSYHGQEGNIELGTFIESEKTAKEVEELFNQLVFKKVFKEV